ncbi:hypothetical protein BDP27DRAFT_1332216 [Rhodocollybia butyracea]|uniref:Uncharacterized protein n=1 Tax=Rhodocollybia butyracea TaxID=206335 RepID=A0A9P5U334_9AGAR|nr:hypothetical protein BDP27DRAFT_1332216 [Rhodocollybia butyracea]
MRLLLYSKNHSHLRYFPYTGFLGVSNVVVEGVVATKFDADLKALPAKQVTVSVRCYEFRLGRIGGVVSNKAIVDFTQVLWTKPEGQEYQDLGEGEYPFKITIPPRSGGFSTVSFVEYRCVWRVEATIHHAHISGIGSRLVKHIDLPLVRYDASASPPSSQSLHLDRVITKPKSFVPLLRYCISAPKSPIGPTDLLPISIHVLAEDPNISIRSATVVVERRILFNEQSPVSASAAIPIPKSSSDSLFLSSSSPSSQSLPSGKPIFGGALTPLSSGCPSTVSLANDARPLLPPKHRIASDSSESLNAGKNIVLPITGSESSGPFTQQTPDSKIWSKTLTVQWPSAKPSSRWGIGETIHSDLVSIRFYARVKIIVTTPQSTDSYELDEEEVFITSTNDAERRLAISKTHLSASEARSKSKSPRRTRRKRENTPGSDHPLPSANTTSPSTLRTPSPTYGPSKPSRTPRRPHTSAGPRDTSNSLYPPFGDGKSCLNNHGNSSPSSARFSPLAGSSKKRPATSSTISTNNSSGTQLTRSNVFGNVFSPAISSTTLSSTTSSGSGSGSADRSHSTSGSSSRSAITAGAALSSYEDSADAAVKEWEAELARIELKSRRSSDLLGFGFKRRRPMPLSNADVIGASNKPSMLQT